MTRKLYIADKPTGGDLCKPNYFHQFLVCLILALAAAAVFYQVCTYDFVNYDDPGYVYQNPGIQTGITPETIKWAFTTGYFSYWHPLTWLSHMLDWRLFGPDAGGHHLTNLLFHIANTLLLFIVLNKMTGALWQSAFVAALFALHPMHVESVAWIAERKDVLSTFFWMLTMWAYVRYTKRPKIGRYLFVVVFLAFAMMSKPMTVTLPFVLLLLDYWPLNRLNLTDSPKHEEAGSKYSFTYLLIEKIPLFAMVLVLCIVTYIAQKKVGTVYTTEEFSMPVRFANTSISYLQYIIKMLWPSRLAMFYPHPGQSISFLYAAVSVCLLLGVTIFILRFAKNNRYLVTGWFWYLGTLVPVIGLVQVSDQAMADRYSYITLTGLFIIIAWGIPDMLAPLETGCLWRPSALGVSQTEIRKWPYRKIVLWVFSLIVLSSLAICAHLQQRYWKNTETLCRHALAVTDNNYHAHYSIVPILLKQGLIEEAIWHSTEDVRIRPRSSVALNGLGMVLHKAGRIDEAINCYKKAIEVDPNSASIHSNLALALAAKGRFAEAVSHCRIALAATDTIILHNTLGFALQNLGRFQEAVTEYRKVYSAMPDNPKALNGLVYALIHSGEFDEAISLCSKALQTAPDSIDIHINLASALAGSGKFAEAVKEYGKILRIQPQNAVAHNDLGTVLFRQGKFDEAIAHFNQAIRIDANCTDAENNLNLAIAEKQKLQSDKTGKDTRK